MRLRFSKEDLFRYLQMLEGVVPTRSTMPILSNMLITAKETVIEVAATDLEVGVRVVVPGEVEEPGAITIGARKLFEIVRELPPEEVIMSTTANNRLELKCGEGVYKIIGLEPDDFPAIPSIEPENVFAMDSDNLCGMLNKVSFCASTDDTRVILNGVYLNFDQEKSDVVATDGRRMALAKQPPAILEGEDPIKVILPLKAVDRIPKLFAEGLNVNIQMKDSQIIFSDAEATLVSRLIEGEYPNYEQLIPNEDRTEMTFNVSETLGSLRRVALLSNPKTYAIRLDIDSLTAWFSAQTPDLGEAQDSLGITGGHGELQVAFDARFLREAIASIRTDDFRVQFKDGASAMLLKPTDTDDHVCLIMPMRLE